MLLYNVTVKILNTVHDEWLQWMREKHIPEVMATGLFLENRICHILGEDDSEGTTYAFQYVVADMETFQRYQKEFAPALQKDHAERYANQYVAFRTLMEVI